MATLTAIKRNNHYLRYVRKDARTLIYRALYGSQHQLISGEKRSNIPSADRSRHLPENFHYNDAEAALDYHKSAAGFTPNELAALQVRLDQLKRYKHTEA